MEPLVVSTRLAPNASLRAHPVADGLVLHDPSLGTVYALSAPARAVWEASRDDASLAEVVGTLPGERAPEEAESAIRRIAADLHAQGLLALTRLRTGDEGPCARGLWHLFPTFGAHQVEVTTDDAEIARRVRRLVKAAWAAPAILAVGAIPRFAHGGAFSGVADGEEHTTGPPPTSEDDPVPQPGPPAQEASSPPPSAPGERPGRDASDRFVRHWKPTFRKQPDRSARGAPYDRLATARAVRVPRTRSRTCTRPRRSPSSPTRRS